MITALLRLFRCYVLRRHSWGRGKDSYMEDDDGTKRTIHVKTCRHCPATVPVKRRKAKP